jgi:hypothetical protein
VDSYTLYWDEGDADRGQDAFTELTHSSDRRFKLPPTLSPARSYRFYVTAINVVGTSPPSAVLVCATKSGTPDCPIPPALVFAGEDSIKLAWNEPAANGAPITAYEVQMSGAFGLQSVYSGLEKQCVVTGLTRATTFVTLAPCVHPRFTVVSRSLPTGCVRLSLY